MVPIYCSPNGRRCGKLDCPKNIDRAPRGIALTTKDLSHQCDSFFPVFVVNGANYSDAMQELTDKLSEHPEYTAVGFLRHVKFPNLTAEDVVRIYNSIKEENNV